jgi:hypothetical protein
MLYDIVPSELIVKPAPDEEDTIGDNTPYGPWTPAMDTPSCKPILPQSVGDILLTIATGGYPSFAHVLYVFDLFLDDEIETFYDSLGFLRTDDIDHIHCIPTVAINIENLSALAINLGVDAQRVIDNLYALSVDAGYTGSSEYADIYASINVHDVPEAEKWIVLNPPRE